MVRKSSYRRSIRRGKKQPPPLPLQAGDKVVVVDLKRQYKPRQGDIRGGGGDEPLIGKKDPVGEMGPFPLAKIVLPGVFAFADPKDLATIARVSKGWKSMLSLVEQKIWRSLMQSKCPRLTTIIAMGFKDADRGCSYDWKEGYKTLVASRFTPKGPNQALQKELEVVFRPRGIIAYCNCCGWLCNNAYGCGEPDFEIRNDGGIYYVELWLGDSTGSGETYRTHRKKYATDFGKGADSGILASYDSPDYIHENWEHECKLLAQLCALVGLEEGEFNIHPWHSRKVVIEPLKPFFLEYVIDSDEWDSDGADDSDSDSSDGADDSD
jgi:hypothetical protein